MSGRLAFWLARKARRHLVTWPGERRVADGFDGENIAPLPGWPVVSPERARELHDMPYPEYLRTLEWRRRAWLVKEEAGWRCIACGSDDHLQAHHLFYNRRGAERPTDLMV